MYNVTIDVDHPSCEDHGYDVGETDNPKEFVAKAQRDGGVWLGQDAFIPYSTIREFWFHEDNLTAN
jgi:hypothetical protein